MPAPIPDATRAAILADVRAGKLSRRAIADKHFVSRSSVTNIANRANIPDPFDRAVTQNATRARVADMASQRAAIAAELLGDVSRLRDRAWTSYQVVANGADGPEVITLPLPPLRDVQAAYTAVGISLDKHLALVKHDADPGVDSARSMLGALAAGLGAAYDQLTAPPADAG